MDRVISLLAALVGLIALGGAILVHTNADAQRAQMAGEIAQLKLSVGLIGQQQSPAKTAAAAPASASEPSAVLPLAAASEPPSQQPASEPASQQPASASAAPATETADMKALLERISALEQTTKDQASQLDAARAELASKSSVPAVTAVAAGEPGAIPTTNPEQGASAAAIVPDGATKDCIPLGTRFMAQSGDSFPICKTKVVVKVASVSDGLATIAGPGDVAVGSFGALSQGCQVSVVSADTTGYAEMRVTCQ